MGAVSFFFLKTRLGQWLAGIVLAAMILALAYHQIRSSAFEEAEQSALQEAWTAEQERIQDDAHLQDLDDYSLCREYLRARSVSEQACDTLRGVQ